MTAFNLQECPKTSRTNQKIQTGFRPKAQRCSPKKAQRGELRWVLQQQCFRAWLLTHCSSGLPERLSKRFAAIRAFRNHSERPDRNRLTALRARSKEMIQAIKSFKSLQAIPARNNVTTASNDDISPTYNFFQAT
jgi:hypothetical protein